MKKEFPVKRKGKLVGYAQSKSAAQNIEKIFKNKDKNK